jgi:hypothetical protein
MENNILNKINESVDLEKAKKVYIAPALSVVAFRTEHGYAESAAPWNGWRAESQKLKELDQDLMSQLEAGNNWYNQPVAGYFENDGNSTDLSGGWGGSANDSWF